MPVYKSRRFPESAVVHKYLDDLRGVEIGGALHNSFGVNVINVDYCDPPRGNNSDRMCGEFMPVHIVAPGDDLPFKDKTFDFVISSHVIEHFFDPIGTLKEWRRVATKYIVVIAPHMARCNDRNRRVTRPDELWDRHNGKITESEVGGRDVDNHHNVWTTEAFKELCESMDFKIVEYLDVDDKVGNGFLFVLEV